MLFTAYFRQCKLPKLEQPVLDASKNSPSPHEKFTPTLASHCNSRYQARKQNKIKKKLGTITSETTPILYFSYKIFFFYVNLFPPHQICTKFTLEKCNPRGMPNQCCIKQTIFRHFVVPKILGQSAGDIVYSLFYSWTHAISLRQVPRNYVCYSVAQ